MNTSDIEVDLGTVDRIEDGDTEEAPCHIRLFRV